MVGQANDRLRIAVFSDSALPVLNGVSISIQCLIDSLRDRGHSVSLFTADHFRIKDTDPNTYRFNAIETPWTKGYPLAYPPFYPMLRQFRKQKFDVIHSHTPFTIGFIGLRWAESHEIPIVSTYHTLYDRYAHYIPLPRRYVRYKIAKHTNYYYNRVAHVITPSDAAKKWLQRHAVTTPVSVVPTGAPLPMLYDRGQVRMSLGISPDHKVLLYVGRLAKEKNIETLLHMAAIAFRADSSLRLILVGDGPLRNTCTELARSLKIGDRVRFVGGIPRKEVDKFYAASDLFVFGSISETQGLVIQEAMTYSLPTVAVIGGGAGAGIEHGINGYLVPNDPPVFAQQVLDALGDDRKLAELSVGARKAVRAYDSVEMCDRVLEIYRGCISANQTKEVNLVGT